MHHTQNLLDKNQTIAFQQKIGTLEYTKILATCNRTHECSVASQSRRQGEKCVVRYSRGLRNQNGQQPVNLCESNIPETQVMDPYRSELASRTLFPVKSSSIQNKVTHDRAAVGDGCI